jgi:hypothetical protein
MDPPLQPTLVPEQLTETRLGIQFIIQFNGFFKAIQLYPPGHTMLQQIMEKSFRELAGIMAVKHQIQLRVFENKLYILEQCLSGAAAPGVDNLLREMQRRGIRQITLAEAATRDDLQILVRLLTTPEEELEMIGGAQEFMLQNGAQHIELVEYCNSNSLGINETQLFELLDSELMHFLVTEGPSLLSREELYNLYTITQNPILSVVLLREAVRVLRAKGSALPPTQIILQLLRKLKDSFTMAAVANEQELSVLLRNIILAFDTTTLYELLVINADDDLIRFSEALEHALQELGSGKIAGMIGQQFSQGNTDSTLQHVETILDRLCIDRTSFAAFLPALKEKLKIAGVSENDTLTNQLSNVFSAQQAREGDTDLALGSISTTEQAEIARDLESLREVIIDPALSIEWIRDYDMESNYDLVIHDILNSELSPALFKKLLGELMGRLQIAIENQHYSQALATTNFLMEITAPEKVLTTEQKEAAGEILGGVPSALWEKLTLNELAQRNPQAQQEFFDQMRHLLADAFLGIGLRLYLRENIAARSQTLQLLLRNNLIRALQVYDEKLSLEKTAGANRMLDLFELCPDEPINEYLWELTFHEDRQVAQHALKVIAQLRTSESGAYLLQALGHPTLILRRLAIELLAQFKREDIALRIARIARGEDEALVAEIALQLRLSAFDSLKRLDEVLFQETLRILRKRRRFFFFAAEHKSILAYTRKEMRRKGKEDGSENTA